jgi:hypothetical protein
MCDNSCRRENHISATVAHHGNGVYRPGKSGAIQKLPDTKSVMWAITGRRGQNLRHVREKSKNPKTLTQKERSSLLIIKTEQHHKTDIGATTAAPRTITRRIGNTTYKVNVHFSKTSRETMNDKIMRLIKNEASAKAAGE